MATSMSWPSTAVVWWGKEVDLHDVHRGSTRRMVGARAWRVTHAWCMGAACMVGARQEATVAAAPLPVGIGPAASYIHMCTNEWTNG